jgi:two-component system chemotaxis response regulator CheB
LEGNPRIQVVGEARDGCEAVAQNAELSPDVIVMDVEMPRMNGLAALRRVMEEKPVPVVMFSSQTTKGAQVTVDALAFGAVDFMPKPENRVSISPIAEELCRKIIAAASAKLRRPKVRAARPARSRKAQGSSRGSNSLVIIGSSTGGPQALDEVIPGLPADFPGCVLVCQHMPAGFTASMAKRLDSLTAIPVKEAEDGDGFGSGTVLVAPGGLHTRIAGDGGVGAQTSRIHLDQGEPVHGVRPAVDVTLLDAAPLFGPKLMVVIMTGMGFDGAKGAKIAKSYGATVVCQDESSSVVWGMPRACLEVGACDKVLPLSGIAGAVVEFAKSAEESA